MNIYWCLLDAVYMCIYRLQELYSNIRSHNLNSLTYNITKPNIPNNDKIGKISHKIAHIRRKKKNVSCDLQSLSLNIFNNLQLLNSLL